MRSRAALHLEILALRHQLQVLKRSRPRRLHLAKADRWLSVWLSVAWSGWRGTLMIVKPETVIAWHRQGLRLFWRWKSRRHSGRPPVATDVRCLIRRMSKENPLWGATRIHGELLTLGVDVSQATVAKYMARPDDTAVTVVAHLPRESSSTNRRRRLLRGADRDVPAPVRARDPGARAPSDRARRRHRPSHGGVDGATTSRSISVERGAALSGSRS